MAPVMSSFLLVVSSDRRSDEALLARGESPRRDYLELARSLNADVFDAGSASAGSGKLARHSAVLAWKAARLAGRYEVVFTDNERVGLFLAILLRARKTRPAHVMLGHHLTPWKKRPGLLLARKGIDRLIVHSLAQQRLACERLGFAATRVHVLPYQVDTQFWHPLGQTEEDIVSTAGLECRDYPMLLQAAESLPARIRIGAASHWSSKRSGIDRRTLPPNVDVRAYDYIELRQLYDRSRFVVAPLLDTDFQAGITLILEAMAMARAVVVSDSTGLPRVVRGPVWVDGRTSWPEAGPAIAESTGIYVPPGRPGPLHSAMQFLLAHPDVARALGRNGRAAAEQEYDITHFVRRFAQAIQQASPIGITGVLKHAAG